MSHTSYYTIRDQEVVVIHNGDWSGSVRVRYTDENQHPVEVTLPGQFLVQLGKAAAITALRLKVIGAIEQFDEKDI